MRKRSLSLSEPLGPVKLHMDELEALYKVLQEAQETVQANIPADAFKLISSEADSLSVEERWRLLGAIPYEAFIEARRVSKPIVISTPGYEFDDIDDLKALKPETLPELSLQLTYPFVSVTIGESSLVFVKEDTALQRGISQQLCEILRQGSVKKKRLIVQAIYMALLIVIVTLAVTAVMVIGKNSIFSLPTATIWVIYMVGAFSCTWVSGRLVPANVSRKYKIDDPGFFASKGESVSSKIVLVVITAVITAIITGTVLTTINYSAGHWFGAPVPVASPSVPPR